MKRVLLASAALIAIWSTTQFAKADAIVTGIYDPLHFTCTNCGIDNQTLTPVTAGQQPTGVTVNETGTTGGVTGDFVLKVLIPTNFSITSEQVTGTIGGVNIPTSGAGALFANQVSCVPAGCVQGTTWSTGSLEVDFLGFALAQGGSPPNPIGAFLPSTTAVDPLDTTGFFVLTLDLGQLTVPEQGGQNPGPSPFSLNFSNLPNGSWILGDLITSDCGKNGPPLCDTTTAQSAALFATPTSVSVPGPIVGAGLPGLITALFGMIGLNRYRKRRSLAA